MQAVLSTNYAHALQEERGNRRTGTSSRLSSSLPITASGKRHRPNSLFHQQVLVTREDLSNFFPFFDPYELLMHSPLSYQPA